jgi:hypothetical protein
MPHTGSSLEIGILIGKKLGGSGYAVPLEVRSRRLNPTPWIPRLNLTIPKI